MTARSAFALCIGLVCLFSGCATAPKPQVVDRTSAYAHRFEKAPETYRVMKGDTLYSIAWRYGLDTSGLASSNGIAKPFTIYPGQVLSLVINTATRPPGKPPTMPAVAASSGTAKPAKPTEKKSAPQPRNETWLKPVSRPVSLKYGNKNKGVNYLLNVGDDVKVTRSGEVVYAGTGLGGYRRLVIVQHDSEYLSAYSFNHEMLVREGGQIRRGDPVTRAMNTQGLGPNGQTLHFEIRRRGQPVDPGSLIGRH
ncbi:MAG: peptidoglycan DD-metalloendopeptidase family protein [Proteobacteria bacterium]|nr:peptidoglycan DD-metalloendopeptidase family protein [Pseudomonadota bacterium]